MQKKDVVDYFGSQNKTSKFIGISRQAVGKWPEQISVDWALYFDKVTNGELEFHKEAYQ